MASRINADNGVVSGVSGINYTGDNSGVMALQTNGNTAVTIDSSGNVGVGTASPSYKLDVQGTTANQRISSTTGTNAAYQIFSNTGQNFYVGLDNSAGNQILSAAYGATLLGSGAYPMVFGTNNTERMRINAGAPILCLAGGSTTATGTGIAFPATQSASSDANTLDDYEEGTWTPTIGGTATYYTRSGRYVKIGNAVSIYGTISISAIGTGSTNIISGLPFSSGSECCIPVDKSQGISTAITWMALRTAGTDLYAVTRTAASVSGTVNATFMTSGTEVQFAGTYII